MLDPFQYPFGKNAIDESKFSRNSRFSNVQSNKTLVPERKIDELNMKPSFRSFYYVMDEDEKSQTRSSKSVGKFNRGWLD